MRKVAYRPRASIETSRGRKVNVSRALRSVNSRMYCVFSEPNATRLYSQTEYAAERTIPAVEKIKIVLFWPKIPTKMRSSPRKFDVAGKLIFARVNAKKNAANSGITAATPP